MAGLGDVIDDANARYGLPSGYLGRVAGIESSGNPNASNGAAKGLYQFIPSTAAHYGLANPFDPAAASDAAGRLSRDSAAYLGGQLGHAPTAEQLYLAHQQGAGGAAKLLLNPNALAASIVGASAVTNNGGTADMTAGQFADFWARKFDGRSGQLPFFARAAVGAGAQQQPGANPPTGSVATYGPASPSSIPTAPADDGTAAALALALSAPGQQSQGQLADLYAPQGAAQQQQAAAARRAALLSSAGIAATQQIG